MNIHLTNTFQKYCSVIHVHFRGSKVDLNIDNKKVNISSSNVFASAIGLLTQKMDISSVTIHKPDDCQKVSTILDAFLYSDKCSVRFLNIIFDDQLKIDTLDTLVKSISGLNDNIFHMVIYCCNKQQGNIVRSKINHHKIHTVVPKS